MALPSNMVKLFINSHLIAIETHQLSIKIKFTDNNTAAKIVACSFCRAHRNRAIAKIPYETCYISCSLPFLVQSSVSTRFPCDRSEKKTNRVNLLINSNIYDVIVFTTATYRIRFINETEKVNSKYAVAFVSFMRFLSLESF